MGARSLSAQDHARIAEAIRQAELKTSGEIYCVVARSSSGYFFEAALFVVLAMQVAALAVAFGLEHWWVSLRLPHFAAIELLAVLAALGLLWLLASLRLAFVPLRHRYRCAHDNALKQFLARNVHRTAERTGILIFVSLAERYAEVVADSGINARVAQEAWNGIVAELVAHARKDRLAEGFLAAIAMAGAILAEHFPVSDEDRNELDDHLVEI